MTFTLLCPKCGRDIADDVKPRGENLWTASCIGCGHRGHSDDFNSPPNQNGDTMKETPPTEPVTGSTIRESTGATGGVKGPPEGPRPTTRPQAEGVLLKGSQITPADIEARLDAIEQASGSKIRIPTESPVPKLKAEIGKLNATIDAQLEVDRLRRAAMEVTDAELAAERKLHQGDHEILEIVTGRVDAHLWLPAAATQWADRQRANLETLRDRARQAAQAIIAEIGSAGGSENVDAAAERAVAEIKRLKALNPEIGGFKAECQACGWTWIGDSVHQRNLEMEHHRDACEQAPQHKVEQLQADLAAERKISTDRLAAIEEVATARNRLQDKLERADADNQAAATELTRIMRLATQDAIQARRWRKRALAAEDKAKPKCLYTAACYHCGWKTGPFEAAADRDAVIREHVDGCEKNPRAPDARRNAEDPPAETCSCGETKVDGVCPKDLGPATKGDTSAEYRRKVLDRLRCVHTGPPRPPKGGGIQDPNDFRHVEAIRAKLPPATHTTPPGTAEPARQMIYSVKRRGQWQEISKAEHDDLREKLAERFTVATASCEDAEPKATRWNLHIDGFEQIGFESVEGVTDYKPAEQHKANNIAEARKAILAGSHAAALGWLTDEVEKISKHAYALETMGQQHSDGFRDLWKAVHQPAPGPQGKAHPFTMGDQVETPDGMIRFSCPAGCEHAVQLRPGCSLMEAGSAIVQATGLAAWKTPGGALAWTRHEKPEAEPLTFPGHPVTPKQAAKFDGPGVAATEVTEEPVLITIDCPAGCAHRVQISSPSAATPESVVQAIKEQADMPARINERGNVTWTPHAASVESNFVVKVTSDEAAKATAAATLSPPVDPEAVTTKEPSHE